LILGQCVFSPILKALSVMHLFCDSSQ
jgi:hypothetical protein